MTISIWRLSHLLLAIVSSVFIALASITGLILAFEPVSNQILPYHINDEVSIAETVTNLKETYEEVFTIEVDENDFVSASVITNLGDSETFYINPKTGSKLGDLIEKKPLFEFATNLHRSLFLKSTGRVIVGIVSFLLILIAITGLILIIRRQGSIKASFSKIVKEGFNQYYHVFFGRLFLIPILIVAVTGVYLSLEKFSLLPKAEISHKFPDIESKKTEKVDVADFDIFRTLKISDLKSLEFPFSDAVEDYYFLELKNSELLVNQYTGEIISEETYPVVQMLTDLSMVLHTGQGTVLWSLILAMVCVALLFFIYSGFAMTFKGLKTKDKIQNNFSAKTAKYIILVGSESRTTFKFAQLFFKGLLKRGEQVYIADLNSFSTYDNAEHLIVFTSTYGDGDAPANANKFKKLLEMVEQEKNIDFSIVGFGSLLYPQYCKFAEEVDVLLNKKKEFSRKLPLFKINNQSFEAFKHWIVKWNDSTGVEITIDQPIEKLSKKHTREFEVIKRTELNNDSTFLLQLRPTKKIKFQSGDLLAFQIKENEAARYYSVAKIDGDILLSIKKHQNGLCSSFLSQLKTSDLVTATVTYNKDFHLPSYADDVVLISNGTGIAPFLGMINNDKLNADIHLFWGGRTQHSLQLYTDSIDRAFHNKTLKSFHTAYSQEHDTKFYIQNTIAKKADLICKVLQNNGTIMICGSVSMQSEVLKTLNNITKENLNEPLSTFEAADQLKMDCY